MAVKNPMFLTAVFFAFLPYFLLRQKGGGAKILKTSFLTPPFCLPY